MRRFPSHLATALAFLALTASDVGAQVVQDLLGHWGGRVQSRRETVYDPAASRQATPRAERLDEFWVLSIRDYGGQMEGWQRYTDHASKQIIMTENAYGYPLAVTEVNPDGDEFKIEWSQGPLECEANVELKDEATKLEGRYVCRRQNRNRNSTVMEWVTRGRLELTPYDRTQGGGS